IRPRLRRNQQHTVRCCASIVCIADLENPFAIGDINAATSSGSVHNFVDLLYSVVEWRARMADNLWEVYALRYAHHERAARENFMVGGPHDESPMPLDYYVWAAKSS